MDYVKDLQLSSLTGMFRQSTERRRDSERLRQLYASRAELKEETAQLRADHACLQEKLHGEQGETARLRQKLEHMERLFRDPASADGALVHYQLRGLGERCTKQLSRFAEQLKVQRERREHNVQLVRWNEDRTRRLQALERELQKEHQQVRQLETTVQEEEQRIAAMSAVPRILRRRSIRGRMTSLKEQIKDAEDKEHRLAEAMKALRHDTPPETRGLDVATKRLINCTILAFAQHLWLLLGDGDLAAAAKTAASREAGSVNYGSADECRELLARVQRAHEALGRETDIARVLQRRARLISEAASYRHETDAVPIAASVRTICLAGDNGAEGSADADLLGPNYWGMADAFSH